MTNFMIITGSESKMTHQINFWTLTFSSGKLSLVFRVKDRLPN